MGCGFKIENQDVILQLLSNDFPEYSLSKENDLCSWALESNVNNTSLLSSRIANLKINPKPNGAGCRTYLGYKGNNKVNTYTFRHYKSSENYMIQYRNEHKSQRCLPYNADTCDNLSVHSHADNHYEIPSSGFVTHKLCPDPPEKPIIHQVRFWQNQNPLIQPMGEINQLGDGFRPNNTLQISNSVIKPNNSNAFAQRSSFNTKRNLDMVIPQGTAYDILSDDNRFQNRDDSEKLKVKVTEESAGPVNVPYSYIRESTKIKRFPKEGGSLEFARLLDEKLRQLYEQKSLYQPIIEINRLKPENRYTKPISTRMKSANQIKEKSNLIVHSNSLNSLSVNGQSAGARCINVTQKLPISNESQVNYRLFSR